MTNHQDNIRTRKLLILLLLLVGQIKNAVYLLTVGRMTVTEKGVTFSPNQVFKYSKVGRKLDSFHYRGYHDKKKCVVDCLKKYSKYCNTKVQTDTKPLLIAYSKPFRTLLINPMRSWVKDFFKVTSILKEYTLQSCR